MIDWKIVLLWYLLGISIVSVIVTCYDKWAATHRTKHRTPEKTLLLLSVFGGSVAMYLTMQCIRHKTKHMKFMIGIPAIIILQIGLVVGILYMTKMIV